MSWKDVLITTLFTMLFVVGLIGNSLVIYIYGFVYKKRFLKFERLLLLLGIVDLFATISNAAMYMYLTLHGYANWSLGVIGCKVLPIIGPILSNFSLGIILILTIDRDRAISTPLKTQFGTHIIVGAVILNFALSILSLLPYCYYSVLDEKSTCFMKTNQYSLIWNIVIFILSDVMFVLVFVFTTTRIALSVKKNRKVAPVLENTESKANKVNKERSATRICWILIGMGCIFIICVFPRDIYLSIYYIYQLNPPFPLPRNYHLFFRSLVKLFHTANSSVNVFVYSIINSSFRRDLKKTIRKFFKRVLCLKVLPEDEPTSVTTFQ